MAIGHDDFLISFHDRMILASRHWVDRMMIRSSESSDDPMVRRELERLDATAPHLLQDIGVSLAPETADLPVQYWAGRG